MSVDTCYSCGRPVDTDIDDHAYVVTLICGKELHTGVCRCQVCRHDPFVQIRTSLADIRNNLDAMTYGGPEWMAARGINESAPDDRAAIDP